MRRPPKPRITKPRLKWRWNARRREWEPLHRVTATIDGKRKERAIVLKWGGDPRTLDELYWKCESGSHERQKPAPSACTWEKAAVLWRSDPRVKAGHATRRKYEEVLQPFLTKNGTNDMRHATRAGMRAIHLKFAATPRVADRYIETLRMLWNYAKKKQDWPLGDNPAAGIDLYGKQREFEPWPDWMVTQIDTAPPVVRAACELILGTGQRPNAAIEMRFEDFSGEWMTVLNEKSQERYEIFCPERLRAAISSIDRKGAHVIAKNLTEPLGYDAVEKQFRAWRNGLGDQAAKYVMHGLRKLAIIQLAESGATDAEIQAITNQSLEMIAYYRRRANRRVLSRNAARRREAM